MAKRMMEVQERKCPNWDISFIAAHGVSDEDDMNTHQNTREEIAEELGVSTGTVAMMEQIDKKSKEGKVASRMLEDLWNGKTSVSKVYSDLKKNEGAERLRRQRNIPANSQEAI